MKKAISQSNSSIYASFFQRMVVGLFNFLVISVPLYFSFNTSELFEFNKMVLTYAVTVIILAAWVCRMIASGKIVFKKTFLDLPIIIFLISQLLSVIFSIHPYTSWLGYYSRFHGGLASVLTYTILYYAFVSNIEKKHLSTFFLSLTGAGILVSLYGVLEHFSHSISCLIVSEGKDFGVSCWIQDVKTRVFATFGQPNWLAAYLIMLLPVSFVLSLKKYKNIAFTLYFMGGTLLFLITLLFTKSRSGFLGAGVGMALVVGILLWKLWRQKEFLTFISASKNKLLVLTIGTLVVVAAVGTPYTPQLSSLLNTSPVPSIDQTVTPVVNRLDIGGTDSGDIRKIVWQGAIKVWQRYPLFGSGLETFAYSYYQDRPLEHNYVSEWDFLYNKAHNEFLNFLATTGVVGLLSYVTVLGYFLWYTFKKILLSQTRHSTYILSAVIGGVVALSISNFFGFSTVMVTVLMYVYFGLVVVITTNEVDTPEKQSSLTSTSYLLLSATGLFGIFLLRIIYQYWSADVAYTKGKGLLDAGYFEQGIPELHQAIKDNPQEATFYDELANQYASYAVPYAEQGKTEQTKALMLSAEEVSDATIKLNPRQLNFYKTRARVFITLAQIKPEFLHNAKETLLDAQKLAPTDPKLVYNIGIVELSLNENEAGVNHLKQAIELKPNYESARMQLAAAYENAQNYEGALEQYRYIVENITPNQPLALEKIASISAQIKTTEK
jgi:O-antigen ligase